MAKTLKIWNGRGAGNATQNCHTYVAAFTKKQAVEIINESCKAHINTHELTHYYCEGAWGNSMDHITPTEPCVFIDYYNQTPVQVYPIQPNQDIWEIANKLRGK